VAEGHADEPAEVLPGTAVGDQTDARVGRAVTSNCRTGVGMAERPPPDSPWDHAELPPRYIPSGM